MSARDIIEDISNETGVCWDENSLISILTDYIDNQKNSDAFEEYVARRAAEELEG